MKIVYIFTKNGCMHCRVLKKRLFDESIPFHNIEITKNIELWNDVVLQTGFDILPTVFIQVSKDGSGTVYTPNKDFKDINEIVEIIKKEL